MTEQFFKAEIEEAERNASCKDDTELYYRGLSFAYGKSEQAVKDWILKLKDKLRYYWDTDEHEELTGEIFEDIIDKSAKEDLGIDTSQETKPNSKSECYKTSVDSLQAVRNKKSTLDKTPDTHNQDLEDKK
jgi:hypothetical protein